MASLFDWKDCSEDDNRLRCRCYVNEVCVGEVSGRKSLGFYYAYTPGQSIMTLHSVSVESMKAGKELIERSFNEWFDGIKTSFETGNIHQIDTALVPPMDEAKAGVYGRAETP